MAIWLLVTITSSVRGERVRAASTFGASPGGLTAQVSYWLLTTSTGTAIAPGSASHLQSKYAGSFPLATPGPLNDAVERVAMFQRGSQELISPGKAGFGTAPLIRYSPETRYRLPNHNVDNDHQDGRMGIHRSGGQSGKHKYQSASRAK